VATTAKSIGSANTTISIAIPGSSRSYHLHSTFTATTNHRPHAMKVLEAQSAVLSNYEVHEHLMEQRKRYKKVQRRGPPNHENVVKEVRQLP
jgi:copper(I)-binding protein